MTPDERTENAAEKKQPYTPPTMEEHNIMDKTAGCNQYEQRYVSGYGYWH
jgi:hypothetical protein